MANFDPAEYSDPVEFLALTIPYGMVAGIAIAIALVYFDLIPDEMLGGEMAKKGYVERCADGVAYIDNGRMITPKLMLNGLPAACRE